MNCFISKYLPQHKYAIDAKILGDDAILAWSNLGYWLSVDDHYVFAAQSLADHIAKALALSHIDHLLDLGCGQGASLKYWKQAYRPALIEAVELQEQCVKRIKKHLPDIGQIYQCSFLDLDQFNLENKFSVIVCIDAAYHFNLNKFLTSVKSVSNGTARLGFHTLVLSDQWLCLTPFQKLRYAALLKSADVKVDDLLQEQEVNQMLQEYDFKNIVVEDLSKPVLLGFANFVKNKRLKFKGLDSFKIIMTAKLCQKLYQDGLIRYVQVTARQK